MSCLSLTIKKSVDGILNENNREDTIFRRVYKSWVTCKLSKYPINPKVIISLFLAVYKKYTERDL